jgi:hypothetical protein
LEPRFNCFNPTYLHKVVIILVSLVGVVLVVIMHNITQTKFPTCNQWPILTRIALVTLHAHEAEKKYYSDLAREK